MHPRILYIDDDKDAHLLFEIYARQVLGSVAVISAFDGEDGINKYVDSDGVFEPIGLVVTDYNLPKKNGDEVVRAIKKSGSTVPIYVASAYPLDQLQKMNIVGANALLAKPFIKEDLEIMLKAAFRPLQ